jgi:hypothetical protein
VGKSKVFSAVAHDNTPVSRGWKHTALLYETIIAFARVGVNHFGAGHPHRCGFSLFSFANLRLSMDIFAHL